MKKFVVLTLFTNMFNEFVNTSVIKHAIDKELVSIDVVDIRDFTQDKHKRVDFPPAGGGSGMIISAEPLSLAIDFAMKMLGDNFDIEVVYLSPRGKVLNYNLAYSISKDTKNYILICGHYEGIDERVIEEYNIKEISIGDYVLTGGELASQVLIDSVVRLIPGVISEDSLSEESHTNNLLEYPQYTRPDVFRGKKIPEILKSGNHKKIAEYRKNEAIKITLKNRPDLIEKK